MPGEVDISAYVDFAALKGVIAKHKELVSSQIMPQGCFLEAMGISARVEMLGAKNPTKIESLAKDYERLASPDEMGEIYKCLFAASASVGEIYPFESTLTYEKSPADTQ